MFDGRGAACRFPEQRVLSGGYMYSAVPPGLYGGWQRHHRVSSGGPRGRDWVYMHTKYAWCMRSHCAY